MKLAVGNSMHRNMSNIPKSYTTTANHTQIWAILLKAQHQCQAAVMLLTPRSVRH